MATPGSHPGSLSLLTDLYQLTMAQSYFQNKKFESATFSLFVRDYPPRRGYFVSAGLEDVLDFLESFKVEPEAIEYLRSTRIFDKDFLDFLKGLRFTGEVWAIAEGQLFFKDEPALEITAPIIEAQLVETFVINQIHLATMIASKAARCVHAARGRPVVDFSLRRAHGVDAGLKAARSSYLAGFTGTSDVLAGQRYGIPVVGTMAHSFVSCFEREIEAFRSYASSFPENAILLIDTYDTLEGTRRAVAVAREMAKKGGRLRGVRIDSGDLLSLGREVRRILDEAGLTGVQIIASGGLDEYEILALTEAKAPYDSFGVGTKMGVSSDAPWLDMAYKLVEYGGRPVLKLSPGKESWPGRKQLLRLLDRGKRMEKDVVALRDEAFPGAEPMLKKVMENGRILKPRPVLKEIRDCFMLEFENLDEATKSIDRPRSFPVEFSSRLRELKAECARQVT